MPHTSPTNSVSHIYIYNVSYRAAIHENLQVLHYCKYHTHRRVICTKSCIYIYRSRGCHTGTNHFCTQERSCALLHVYTKYTHSGFAVFEVVAITWKKLLGFLMRARWVSYKKNSICTHILGHVYSIQYYTRKCVDMSRLSS